MPVYDAAWLHGELVSYGILTSSDPVDVAPDALAARFSALAAHVIGNTSMALAADLVTIELLEASNHSAPSAPDPASRHDDLGQALVRARQSLVRLDELGRAARSRQLFH